MSLIKFFNKWGWFFDDERKSVTTNSLHNYNDNTHNQRPTGQHDSNANVNVDNYSLLSRWGTKTTSIPRIGVRRATNGNRSTGKVVHGPCKLAQMQCAEAKAIVIKMRKDCYLALSARKEGILLMDSIDIQQAKLELSKADSLMQKQHSISTSDDFDEACRKVQFYERKLQYDSRSTNK